MKLTPGRTTIGFGCKSNFCSWQINGMICPINTVQYQREPERGDSQDIYFCQLARPAGSRQSRKDPFRAIYSCLQVGYLEAISSVAQSPQNRIEQSLASVSLWHFFLSINHPTKWLWTLNYSSTSDQNMGKQNGGESSYHFARQCRQPACLVVTWTPE